MDKKSQRFFQELEAKVGKGNEAKRFLKELHHHAEDKKDDMGVRGHLSGVNTSSSALDASSAKIPETYLGSPKKLAREYRSAFFSVRFHYAIACLVFLLVFVSVEIVPIFIDKGQHSALIEFFLSIGLIFYFLALPVLYITIFLGGITAFLFGFDINTLDFFRFGFWPLITAFFYTFLYFVFFCKPFWGKQNADTIIS